MKHNNRKFINDIIKPLQQEGFVCETRGKNRNKYYISKGANTPTYTVHQGDCTSSWMVERRIRFYFHDSEVDNVVIVVVILFFCFSFCYNCCCFSFCLIFKI